jgi:hypothetical protein
MMWAGTASNTKPSWYIVATKESTAEGGEDMNEQSITHQAMTLLPPDDPQRTLKVVNADADRNLPHIGLVGDAYTILLSGDDSNGSVKPIHNYALRRKKPPTIGSAGTT